MFGNIFGDLEQKQAEMKAKLATISVEAEAGDGAIRVTANANREITNISIDDSKLDIKDKEQLEDLLIVAINRVLESAAAKEAAETENLMNEMLPPGLGGLFGA